jgi:hypothetical protein
MAWFKLSVNHAYGIITLVHFHGWFYVQTVIKRKVLAFRIFLCDGSVAECTRYLASGVIVSVVVLLREKEFFYGHERTVSTSVPMEFSPRPHLCVLSW